MAKIEFEDRTRENAVAVPEGRVAQRAVDIFRSEVAKAQAHTMALSTARAIREEGDGLRRLDYDEVCNRIGELASHNELGMSGDLDLAATVATAERRAREHLENSERLAASSAAASRPAVLPSTEPVPWLVVLRALIEQFARDFRKFVLANLSLMVGETAMALPLFLALMAPHEGIVRAAVVAMALTSWFGVLSFVGARHVERLALTAKPEALRKRARLVTNALPVVGAATWSVASIALSKAALVPSIVGVSYGLAINLLFFERLRHLPDLIGEVHVEAQPTPARPAAFTGVRRSVILCVVGFLATMKVALSDSVEQNVTVIVALGVATLINLLGERWCERLIGELGTFRGMLVPSSAPAARRE